MAVFKQTSQSVLIHRRAGSYNIMYTRFFLDWLAFKLEVLWSVIDGILLVNELRAYKMDGF